MILLIRSRRIKKHMLSSDTGDNNNRPLAVAIFCVLYTEFNDSNVVECRYGFDKDMSMEKHITTKCRAV